MKKLSILLQWLVVLGFLGFAAYALLKGRPVPDRQPASWRGWQGFMALSYPGIEKGNSDVYTSPARLQQQLEALHAAGYRAITPEDALAFLKEGSPLPRKALLLLFEGGRKDSVIFTVKPFRKTGFFGTLCLPTHVMRSHGAFFLHRGDVQNIARLGFWQFAGITRPSMISPRGPMAPGGISSPDANGPRPAWKVRKPSASAWPPTMPPAWKRLKKKRAFARSLMSIRSRMPGRVRKPTPMRNNSTANRLSASSKWPLSKPATRSTAPGGTPST